MLAIAVVGYLSVERNGYPGRFPELNHLESYAYDYQKNYRVGTCHLNPWQTSRDFTPDCYVVDRARALTLWGDSAIADLAPGLRFVASKQYDIEELTGSACPPLLEYYNSARPNCPELNSAILDHLKRNGTPILVVGMASSLMAKDTFPLFANTISTVQRLNIGKIVVIGPAPVWPLPLPALVVRTYLSDRSRGFPDKLSINREVFLDLKERDLEIAGIARRANAIYVSPLSVLCTENRCQALVSNEPTTWDDQHFTTAGSILVAKAVMSAIETPKRQE